MKILNFYYKLFFIFFQLISSSSNSQILAVDNVPTAEQIIQQVATLPSGYFSSFKSIVAVSNHNIMVLGDKDFWLFDGHNWDKYSFPGKPVHTYCPRGKVYVAYRNQIQSFAFADDGLINISLVLDSTISQNIGVISSIQAGKGDRLFFTTKEGLWKFTDKLVKIDSTDTGITLFGCKNEVYYTKPNQGIFSLNITEDFPVLIPNTNKLVSKSIVGIFNLFNTTFAVTQSYPWLTNLNGEMSKELINIASRIQHKNTLIKKAYLKNDHLYLLTNTKKVLIFSENGEEFTEINIETHTNIEQAVDIYPYSNESLLILTPSAIHSSFNSKIVGFYPSLPSFFGAPISIALSNNYIYYLTEETVYVANYPASKPNAIAFSELLKTNGKISDLGIHNKQVFGAGKMGVFKFHESNMVKIIDQSITSSYEAFSFLELNDEYWVLGKQDTNYISHCITDTRIKPIVFPYPHHNHTIEKISTYKGRVFVLLDNGDWHLTDLNKHPMVWENIDIANKSLSNFFIPANQSLRPFITLNEALYSFDYMSNTLGDHIACDPSGHLMPIYENDSIMVIKRIVTPFPSLYSLWLYKFSDKNKQWEPKKPIAVLSSNDIVKKAHFTQDSTLLLLTSSGFYYFVPSKTAYIKPNVSIHRATLESKVNSYHIRDGYFHKSTTYTPKKSPPQNRNLKAAFASNSSSSWNSGQGIVQFSSLLEGYESEWTPWTRNNMREINRLRPGTYTLKVKARNIWFEESSIAVLSFVIQPKFFEIPYFIASFIVLGLLGLITLYSWRRYLHTKVRYKLESLINMRTEELVKEKEKTDNLLARVLPKETASELKEKGRVNTQRFQVVTVLFCDIEGFTRITEETNPEILIDQLDRFFLYFDSVVEKYRIEKIKTIGDAYMCAGGIPKKNRTNPVEVVLAALEMMHYMQDIISKSNDSQNIWELRIGIDTGPVIAGVVGRNKLSYDIWGSTVNTASRMESSGEAGEINISENTYMLVSDYFECSYRGIMPVKNKGDIQMYFVNGIKLSLSKDFQGIVPSEEFKIMIQLIRLGDLEDFILEKLEKGLPQNLYYHDLKHTIDVYTQVELIGRSENVSKEEMLLLRTAALFHDAGHLIDYDTHEEMAVKFAREILPEYHYTEKQIEIVSALIMSTKLPPTPKNLLEEIMCDADLDYLGRTDFIPVSNTLYQELHDHGKVGTLNEWNELQIKFITKHSYFTKTARKLRNVNKKSQLDKLKDWMDKN